MAKTEHSFKSHDDTKIVYFKHSPEKAPKGIIIITHGMADHAQRYDDFAQFLCKHSFVVFAHDQRGHGKTAGSLENIGFFAEHDGWQKVSDDLGEFVNVAKKKYSEIPVILLGHSMGSFIVRNYIIKHSDKVAGVVFSGTAGSAGLLGIAGNILTSVIMLFKKKNTPSPLMNKLSFGDFNKAFKPNRTEFDWLSRDNKTVDKYIADPYSGNVFSLGFFNDLVKGLEYVNKSKFAGNVRNDLPIYLFAGDKDPVSKNGKQIHDVFNMYKKAGISDIEMKLYPDGRHEMLNEINKEDVYNDILSWLNLKVNN